MHMSAEMLTTLLTGLGLLLSFAGAFAWLILGMDSVRTELKDDSRSLRTEFKDDLGSLRTELKDALGSLRSEVKSDIRSLRTEVKSDIRSLRTEVKSDIGCLRTDLSTTNRDLREIRVSVARLEGQIRPGLIRPKIGRASCRERGEGYSGG